jgi:putative DNA primase/helicase
MALDDRASYVAAALNIVRAYMLAGTPNKKPPLASFEGWSDKVRSALVWLGCADPMGSMEKARAEDPVRQCLGTLLKAWQNHIGLGAEHGLTSAKLLANSNLENALSALDPRGIKGLDATRLGRRLADHCGRPVENLKLNRYQDSTRAWVWYVEELPSEQQ